MNLWPFVGMFGGAVIGVTMNRMGFGWELSVSLTFGVSLIAIAAANVMVSK